MKIDTNARYQASHEYARKEAAASGGFEIVVGISDHAQESLGDIVFVELPAAGKVLKKGEAFGVVESVKAASDLYAPVSGKVVAANEALSGDPSLVNKDCYGSGWMIRVAPTDPAEWNALLDAAAYEKEAGKE
ncbi:MAG TPA: glycine cleavage system protein GcvH [Spirochaetales bacterium]|nr:glycine cleavage system protein GcvH [Spirochaetales bacterium]HRZ66422.1 glycine cleavage system protein GcvH [Spirochaetia bacterium]